MSETIITAYPHYSPRLTPRDKSLVIIGAGLFGREVCNYARDAGYAVKGFLDGRANVLGGYNGYPSVLSPVESYEPEAEDVFVCAVGESNWREKYVKIMADKGVTFVNIIHPTAYIGPNVKMGVGCIVCPFAMIDCDLTLGNHVVVNAQCYVPHDCYLEDFVTLSPSCHLGGITTIRRGAFLGIGSATIPHVEIGAYAYIAAGAVVTKNVDAKMLVAGVPAKVVRISGGG